MTGGADEARCLIPAFWLVAAASCREKQDFHFIDKGGGASYLRLASRRPWISRRLAVRAKVRRLTPPQQIGEADGASTIAWSNDARSRG